MKDFFQFPPDIPPQKAPRPTVAPRKPSKIQAAYISRDMFSSIGTTEHDVLSALWNLQAFDSDHAVSVGSIAKAAGEYETSKKIRKAVKQMLDDGVIDFVLYNKRAPKPGEEMKAAKKYYFKDREEFDELKGELNLD